MSYSDYPEPFPRMLRTRTELMCRQYEETIARLQFRCYISQALAAFAWCWVAADLMGLTQ